MLLAVPEVPPVVPAIPAPCTWSLFRMPSVKPITFSGSFRNKPAHEVQNLLDDYLERSHEICILYGFAPSINQMTQLNQPTFVQFASSGLSENARIAWRQIPKDDRTLMTWDAYSAWIQNTFGSTLTLDQALDAMDDLRQTTSAVIYSAKFNELVSAISAADVDYSQKHLCSRYHPARPSPPLKWVNILKVSEEFRDLEDPNAEETYEGEISETGSETETSEPPTISYSNFKKSEKIWIGFQKQATKDADAVRLTLCAIHGGMSKLMQVQYLLHDTPRRTKDPSNRRLDTSAMDTYRGLSIHENQTIPNYLKLICYVEDNCTAAAVIVLTITVHENVIDLEKMMIDLWDSFKAALECNKPAAIKPTANVTIGNPDCKCKHDASKGGKGKSNAYSGKNVKCDNCPGFYNPEYDCSTCWRCSSNGYLSKNCPKKLNNRSNSGGDDRSLWRR
ncbi:hypothetical protein HDU77_007377 [Chytriomyces hyalinus]|nr:hypothetical protein HDU77_007377 [Chytriomyces hyalinus]